MKIAEKWGFGMAPPKAEVQRARIAAVITVLIDNESISLTIPEALEHISIVKGLFNRIAREDQWDWFYVKGQFGYPRFPLERCLSLFLGKTKIWDELNAGWIYVLSTRELPNYFKVGMTARTVEERVREINSATGVLVPFGVRRCWRVMEPSRSEKLVHSALSRYRIKDDREFFSVDIREADPVIRTALDEERLLLRTLENLGALSAG
jgi:hypothetical protein